MNTTHYVLMCKFGPLCHGSKEEVEKERARFVNHSDEEFRIEEYNFQTHMMSHAINEGIVERPKPLTFYCANDLYRAKPIRVEKGFWRNSDQMFPEVADAYSKGDNADQITTAIIYSGEEITLSTLWFQDTPFMICQHWGEDDNFNRFVTDKLIYWRAVDYLNKLNRTTPNDYLDPDLVSIDLTCFGYEEIVELDVK